MRLSIKQFPSISQLFPTHFFPTNPKNSFLLIGPVTLIAAVLGSILNVVLPEAIIYTGLPIILALLACYSVQKVRG